MLLIFSSCMNYFLLRLFTIFMLLYEKFFMRTTNNFLVVLRIIFNTSIENYFFIVLIITSAEREVKDSRRSAMYQSCLSLTRLGLQSLYVFGFIRLFDEVRAELVRDISRSLRFL